MHHLPVLAEEVLELFQGKELSSFVDATVGAGGHASLVLEHHSEIEKFYALDRDKTALALAQARLEPFKGKVDFIHTPFAQMGEFIPQVDGILLDIGVSSMQLDQAGRGFSFYQDGPLDMRMDQEERLSAEVVINRYPEKELATIFWEYGEERRSRQAAKAICEARKKKKIQTTQELTEVLGPVLGWSRRHHHPATRIFQALRIEVNGELNQLKGGIESAVSCLKPGGILAIISFHSLEDRIVKHQFKAEKRVNIITKKPITATRNEQKENKRSRSAKLRAVTRCQEDS